MSRFFVIHQKQGSRCPSKHEQNLEEKAKPIKTDHAAKHGNWFARLTKQQADDDRSEKPASSEPACVTALVFFPERLKDKDQNTENEDQDFGEDRSENL